MGQPVSVRFWKRSTKLSHEHPKMRVEFIYDADCPNVAAARSLLIHAFTKTGASARWREWERSASDTPDYAKNYGSPTILVDGKDVTGLTQEARAANCRVYVG